ncbi:hypothetical protein KVR01_003202 [Diaporthe batatas]|uniref:uncharacterized protein n=1 Tax=Diaporthe batatas TaxID=748121 RepID=UPI001D04730C|nr:uncharacterized protein KVR01_003202 [Diaporthe batatas]KAG8167513.1 hypothetical protein KVR01_003202 [Diaporthe batatas]
MSAIPPPMSKGWKYRLNAIYIYGADLPMTAAATNRPDGHDAAAKDRERLGTTNDASQHLPHTPPPTTHKNSGQGQRQMDPPSATANRAGPQDKIPQEATKENNVVSPITLLKLPEAYRSDGRLVASLREEKEVLEASLQLVHSEASIRIRELEAELAREKTDRGQLDSLDSQVHTLSTENESLQAEVQQMERAMIAERSERQLYQHLYATLRKTITTTVRIQPSGENAADSVAGGWAMGPGQGTLKINNPKDNKPKSFRFDRVFQPQSTNQEIFNEVLALVRTTATEGARAVIMAYGATGTGKSYTLTGDSKASPPVQGLVQLAATKMFEIIPAGSTVEAAAIYIYQGKVIDLTLPKQNNELRINGMQWAVVPDAKYHEVGSAEDIVTLFRKAARNTVTATTRMNEASSRGHTFFMVRIRTPTGNPEQPCEGLLTFADLAGNENTKESGAEGKQFNEARSINTDLMHLKTVIQTMRDGNKPDTKRSKLTQIFAGAAGLDSETAARHDVFLLATVDLSAERLASSMRTLEFASTAIATSTAAKSQAGKA